MLQAPSLLGECPNVLSPPQTIHPKLFARYEELKIATMNLKPLQDAWQALTLSGSSAVSKLFTHLFSDGNEVKIRIARLSHYLNGNNRSNLFFIIIVIAID